MSSSFHGAGLYIFVQLHRLPVDPYLQDFLNDSLVPKHANCSSPDPPLAYCTCKAGEVHSAFFSRSLIETLKRTHPRTKTWLHSLVTSFQDKYKQTLPWHSLNLPAQLVIQPQTAIHQVWPWEPSLKRRMLWLCPKSWWSQGIQHHSFLILSSSCTILEVKNALAPGKSIKYIWPFSTILLQHWVT